MPCELPSHPLNRKSSRCFPPPAWGPRQGPLHWVKPPAVRFGATPISAHQRLRLPGQLLPVWAADLGHTRRPIDHGLVVLQRRVGLQQAAGHAGLAPRAIPPGHPVLGGGGLGDDDEVLQSATLAMGQVMSSAWSATPAEARAPCGPILPLPAPPGPLQAPLKSHEHARSMGQHPISGALHQRLGIGMRGRRSCPVALLGVVVPDLIADQLKERPDLVRGSVCRRLAPHGQDLLEAIAV